MCTHKAGRSFCFLLISLVFLVACSDKSPQTAAALPADNLINGTSFTQDELPFSQFEEKKLPLKVAGLWRPRGTGKYMFISMNGVQTFYREKSHSDCMFLTGPHKLRYYGNNRYVHTSKRGSVQQLEFLVERTAMTTRQVSVNGIFDNTIYDRITDIQPEDLDVCRTYKKNNPYR